MFVLYSYCNSTMTGEGFNWPSLGPISDTYEYMYILLLYDWSKPDWLNFPS